MVTNTALAEIPVDGSSRSFILGIAAFENGCSKVLKM